MEKGTGYFCKECGKPAVVTSEGKILRTCKHETTVVMDLEAVVVGKAGLKNA